MSEHNADFSHESVEDAASIARYLDALRSGLAEGRLELGSGADVLVLRPRGLLELRVEARRRGRRRALSLRVAWSEEPDDRGAVLAIRTTAANPAAPDPQSACESIAPLSPSKNP